MKRRLTGVSFGLALLATTYLLVGPVYAPPATLLQVNGPDVLIPLFLPVLATLMPLLIRKQWLRIITTILMAGFVLVGGFSIGLFYLPATIVLLLASCVDDDSKLRDILP